MASVMPTSGPGVAARLNPAWPNSSSGAREEREAAMAQGDLRLESGRPLAPHSAPSTAGRDCCANAVAEAGHSSRRSSRPWSPPSPADGYQPPPARPSGSPSPSELQPGFQNVALSLTARGRLCVKRGGRPPSCSTMGDLDARPITGVEGLVQPVVLARRPVHRLLFGPGRDDEEDRDHRRSGGHPVQGGRSLFGSTLEPTWHPHRPGEWRSASVPDGGEPELVLRSKRANASPVRSIDDRG
jgi:hypothetical protein